MLLHRINPSQNEFRFYLVVTSPSLFDPYAVIRVWGRMGGPPAGDDYIVRFG
jgi:predicted DNA-binding WGR domain protein